MRRRGALGSVAAGAVALTLLLVGCSGGSGDGADPPAGQGEQRGRAEGTGGGSGGDGGDGGSGEGASGGDEGPSTPQEARELALAVAIAPEDYGAGFVADDPYEPDPGSWAVLNDACVWEREPLPEHVLANVTRNVELPPSTPGSGPLRMMSSVTVFDGVESADARMAGTLEEVLRCPEQQLRADERVTGLGSISAPPGQLSVDDQIYESGQFHSDDFGGPHPYDWMVSRLGPVVIALSAKGAGEWPEAEMEDLALQALTLMQSNADFELG